MPKRSRLSLFAILTTLLLLTWVLVGAYLRLTSGQPKAVDPVVLSPLTPSLDTSVLDTIEARREFGPQEPGAASPSAQSEEATGP